MSLASWIPIISALPLNKHERAQLKRFSRNPDGTMFVEMATILSTYRHEDESIELLIAGLNLHPEFTAARVRLAARLWKRGLIREVWNLLRSSPTPLGQNVTAQKFLLKAAILLDFDAFARSCYEYMLHHEMADISIAKLGELLKTHGLAKAKDGIIAGLVAEGITPLLQPLQASQPIWPVAPSATPLLQSPEASRHDHSVDPSIKGFTVTSVREVFAAPGSKDDGRSEFDTESLAEIYVSQEQFSKALELYKDLFKTAPRNDALRNKVIATARKVVEQKQIDMTLDPGTVTKMETLKTLDRQITFLSTLMQGLH